MRLAQKPKTQIKVPGIKEYTLADEAILLSQAVDAVITLSLVMRESSNTSTEVYLLSDHAAQAVGVELAGNGTTMGINLIISTGNGAYEQTLAKLI